MRGWYPYWFYDLRAFLGRNWETYIFCLVFSVAGFSVGIYATTGREINELVYGVMFIRAGLKIMFGYLILLTSWLVCPGRRSCRACSCFAFVIVGFFGGAAAYYLLCFGGVLGFVNFFFLYFPVMLITYGAIATAHIMADSIFATCMSRERIFYRISIVFLINLTLIAVFNGIFNIFFVNIVIVF